MVENKGKVNIHGFYLKDIFSDVIFDKITQICSQKKLYRESGKHF